MSKCNKQHIGNIEAKFTKKLSNIETVLKKCVAYKRACICDRNFVCK